MPFQNKKNSLERLASSMAGKFSLDPRLVFAVIKVESDWNPYAVRYEPAFKWVFMVDEMARANRVTPDTMWFLQKSSFGLMQVMGAVAYEHGLQSEANPDERTPISLCDPMLGVYYGCKHLQMKSNLYGPDPADIYAAYNAGSVRHNDDGKYVNQGNVDRFLRIYG